MIEKYHGHTYIDMSKFLDYNEFQILEPEIIAGIAQCKSLLALESGWGVYRPLKTLQVMYTKLPLDAFDEFQKDQTVPIDSKARKWANEVSNNVNSKNKLSRYLKSKYGVGCSYWAFQIEEYKHYADSPTDIVDHERKMMEFFPKTRAWFASALLGKIFKSITAANILYVENDGIPYEHYDNEGLKAVVPDNFRPMEFVHLRNQRRGFYLLDEESKDKVQINTWAVAWDVRNYHGSTRSIYPDWSLRIDGEFTDEIKEAFKNG
jgi:hypothetical protein